MNASSPEIDPKLTDRLFHLLLLMLPHHLLSRLVYWLTRVEWPPLKNTLIRAAIRLYRVDMTLAAEPNTDTYASFNAFFTRALDADARPIDTQSDAVISPVDGCISQIGRIQDGRIFQAKGQDYSLDELLGGDWEQTAVFDGGAFATIYLSPRDYHRIHMPLSGDLQRMVHVPGRLFSVSPATTRVIPRLFSRNERIVNLFDTAAGPMAVIMVGAIFVASMDTVWAGTVAPRSLATSGWNYGRQTPLQVALEKGEEMGRFNMGSTVILLFGPEAVAWNNALQPGSSVCMGESIGRLSQA